MTKAELDEFVKNVDAALEEVYVAQANYDLNTPEDIFFLAEEGVEKGLGAVLVHTQGGWLRWFSLENLEF